MNPEHLKKVEKIFHQALEKSEVDRQSFIEAKCQGDTVLLDELNTLLKTTQSGDSIGSIIQNNAKQLKELNDPWVGQIIDQYEIIEEIAVGGMGAVYIGKRIDSEYHQKVAIKLMSHGLVSKQSRQRFLSERQILANLNHPNIASLLDGGTTDSGVPYLVMEYIEGEAIDKYCDKHQLTVKQRIQLILEVCSAIQYAHQNLIVHRDIKTSNILVTDEGIPKLLDFGIAKLLEQQPMEHTIALTQTEMRLLTPEYASPEQIRGEAISTATDVYGVGVLLFKLLTGYFPFMVASYSPAELEQLICKQPPPKPSSAIVKHQNEQVAVNRKTSINKLQHSIQGDLDTIILKSLQKEQQRRYLSIIELSGDLERYLNHFPIVARPDNALYTLKKYINRHRTGFLFSVLSIFSLIVFSIVLGIQNLTIKQEKERALVEAETSKQISNFMISIFNSSDPNENDGINTTSFQLLENAKIEIKNFSNNPLLSANLYYSISTVYHRLGESITALKLINKTIKLQLEYSDSKAEDLANSYYIKGEILFELGRHKESTKTLEQSKEYFQSSIISDEYDKNQPNIILAVIYNLEGDILKAKELDEVTLEITLKKFNPLSREAGDAYTNLGATERHLGEYNNSEKLIRLGLKARLFSKGEISLETAHSYNQLTSTLSKLEKYQEALEYALKGLEVRRLIYKKDHAEIASSLGNIAKIYQNLNQLDAAIKTKMESILVLKNLFREGHYYTLLSITSLGNMFVENKELSKAEMSFHEALELSNKLYDKNDQANAFPLTGLGQVYIKKLKFKLAIQFLEEAYSIRVEELTPNHFLTATTALLLGEALLLNKDSKNAEPYLKKAEFILQNQNPTNKQKLERARNLISSLE